MTLQWVDTNNFQWVEDNTEQWYDILVNITGMGAFIDYDGGVSTVWANTTRVFMGTNNGIKYLNISDISSDTDEPVDLEIYLNDFSDLTYYSTLTSDTIRYIHGNVDTLGIVTSSGIDVVKIDPQSYRSHTTISGAQKCFMTSDKLYYTISGSEWSLNRLDKLLWDWADPDQSYVTGSGIFEAGITINDIFITEATSSGGIDNTIYAATSSGVYKIDEENLTYTNYMTPLLKGTSNNFTSVWVYNNKMYVTSSDYLTTVNLSDNSVYDWYSQTHKGRSGDSLESDNAVDLNVTQGV